MKQQTTRRLVSFAMVTVMLFGMVSNALAATVAPVLDNITASDNTNGKATTDFPGSWHEGENTFDVTSSSPCIAFVSHADGSHERLYCAVVNEEAGHYRFKVNLTEGDKIGVAVKGDASHDGEISVADLVSINQYLNNQMEFDLSRHYAADVSEDKTISVADLVAINQYLNNQSNFKWDIGWELNQESKLTLSADKTDVHIGRSVKISLDSSIQGDYDLSYALSREDGEATGIDVSHLGKNGGTLKFDEAQVVYQLVCTAQTVSGETVTSNTLRFSVDNRPPVMASLSGIVDYNDLQGGYVDGAKVRVNLNAVAYDPDGDSYTIVYDKGDGFVSSSGYFSAGTYRIKAYAVDEFGARSDSIESSFTVDKKNTQPNIYLDKTEVHQGEFVGVHVNTEVLENQISHWNVVDASGREIEFDGSKLDRKGGEIAITGATGNFTLIAYGNDEHKGEFQMGSVKITVRNSCPTGANLSHELVHDNFENPFTADAKIWVHFIPEAIDPDGDIDEAQVIDKATGLPVADGYYAQGTHTLRIYPMDKWGLKGSERDYTFTVGNQAPNAPEFTYTIDYEDKKMVDGKLCVWVDITTTMTDPDGDLVKLYGENNKVFESGYYPKGTYKTRLFAQDAWNAVSGWTNVSFTVDTEFQNDKSNISIDGYYHEVTNHIGAVMNVRTDLGGFETKDVRYTLYAPDGNLATGFELTAGLSGGTLVITQGVGDYRLVAEATEQLTHDNVVLGEIIIHVTNNAPAAPQAQVQIDYDNSQIVDNQLAAYVNIVLTDNLDPDGDKYELVYTGEKLESGYYTNGHYVAEVLARDQWGAESAVGKIEFTVDTSIGNPSLMPKNITVHSGDIYNFTVSLGNVKATEVEYKLTFSDGRDDVILSGRELTGGHDNAVYGEGTYTLTATAVLADGSKYLIGTSQITETNEAPVARVESYEQLKANNNVMDVKFVLAGTDPDGDQFDIYYRLDAGKYLKAENPADLQLKCYLGERTMDVYAVDEFGKQGPVYHYEFRVGGYFGDDEWQPVIKAVVTDDFTDSYTTDAKRKVTFNTTWTRNGTHTDLDLTQATLTYKVDDQIVDNPDGFYKLGSYKVSVYATDNYGVVSKVGETTVTLSNRAPSVRLRLVDGKIEETIQDDEMDLTRVVRTANDAVVDDFDTLGFGSYELALSITDVWGETDRSHMHYDVFSEIPTVKITGHTSIGEKPAENKRNIEFEVATSNYDPAEYEFVYTVDSQPADHINDWYTLGSHTVTVQLRHTVFPNKVSAVDTYRFDLTNQKPVLDDIQVTVHRDQFASENMFTGNAKVYCEFTGTAHDPDGDSVTLHWVIGGNEDAPNNGHFGLGDHHVGLYAIDPWGERSDVIMDKVFTINNQKPIIESLSYRVTNETKMEDGVEKVKIELIVNGSDPDGDPTRVCDARTNEELPQYVWCERVDQTLRVYMKDAFGAYSDIRELEINSLMNGAPSAPNITYEIDYNDVQNPYTPSASALGKFHATADDPDGDSVTIHWNIAGQTPTGEDVTSRVTADRFIVEAYAVDGHGNRGPTSNVVVDLSSAKPVLTAGAEKVRSRMEDKYTENARMWVEFKTSVVDTDPCKIFYAGPDGKWSETVPSGYFRPGMYTYSVYAVDIWGNVSKTVVVNVDLTNKAPIDLHVSVYEDRKNVINKFTEEAAIGMSVAGKASDPDGDGYRLMISVDGSEPAIGSASGHYKPGMHQIDVFAVDTWGAKSEVVVKNYEIKNQAPRVYAMNVPEWTTDDVINSFTEQAKLQLNVDVQAKDFDGDEYKLTYTVDGQTMDNLNRIDLTHGHHDIQAEVIDIFGAKSEPVIHSMDLGIHAPVIDDVTFNETKQFKNKFTTAAEELITFDAVVHDEDDDPYKVVSTLDGTETENLSGYYTRGSHNVTIQAIDVWGRKSNVYSKQFELKSEAPVLSEYKAEVDWNNIQNPYTASATVNVIVNSVYQDSDGDEVQIHGTVNGSAYDMTDVNKETQFKSGHYGANEYRATMKVVDVWGLESNEKSLVCDTRGELSANIVQANAASVQKSFAPASVQNEPMSEFVSADIVDAPVVYAGEESGQSDHMVWYRNSNGWHNYSTPNFNIKSLPGYIQTTYQNKGYDTVFRYEGYGMDTPVPFNNGVATKIGNFLVTITLDTAYNGRYVKILYSVQNIGSVETEFSIGSAADIMIHNNDDATIQANGAYGAFMDGGDGLKFNFVAPNYSTMWYGAFREAYENIFANSGRDPLLYTDSGLAWSWTATISPGETWNGHALIGAGELPDPPPAPNIDSSVDADVNGNLLFYADQPKVISGTATPGSTVHMTIAGQEYSAVVSSDGKFSVNVTVPDSYSSDSATLTYYATTSDGGISETKSKPAKVMRQVQTQFHVDVQSALGYHIAWLDYYDSSNVVNLGKGHKEPSIPINKTIWNPGKHILIVRVMNEMGVTVFDTQPFGDTSNVPDLGDLNRFFPDDLLTCKDCTA